MKRAAHHEVDDFKHILAPTDFEPASADALKLATSLAASFRAQLTLLHVWEVPIYPYMDFSMNSELIYRIEQAAKERLQVCLSEVRRQVPTAQARLETGLPGLAILDVIRQLGVDLVIMGTHGRHGLSHTLLGSVAEKVVRSSAVPVLTVHATNPLPAD